MGKNEVSLSDLGLDGDRLVSGNDARPRVVIDRWDEIEPASPYQVIRSEHGSGGTIRQQHPTLVIEPANRSGVHVGEASQLGQGALGGLQLGDVGSVHEDLIRDRLVAQGEGITPVTHFGLVLDHLTPTQSLLPKRFVDPRAQIQPREVPDTLHSEKATRRRIRPKNRAVGRKPGDGPRVHRRESGSFGQLLLRGFLDRDVCTVDEDLIGIGRVRDREAEPLVSDRDVLLNELASSQGLATSTVWEAGTDVPETSSLEVRPEEGSRRHVAPADDAVQVEPNDGAGVHVGGMGHLADQRLSLFPGADVIERGQQDVFAIHLEARHIGLGPAALARGGPESYLDRLDIAGEEMLEGEVAILLDEVQLSAAKARCRVGRVAVCRRELGVESQNGVVGDACDQDRHRQSVHDADADFAARRKGRSLGIFFWGQDHPMLRRSGTIARP